MCESSVLQNNRGIRTICLFEQLNWIQFMNYV